MEIIEVNASKNLGLGFTTLLWSLDQPLSHAKSTCTNSWSGMATS